MKDGDLIEYIVATKKYLQNLLRSTKSTKMETKRLLKVY